MNSDTPAAELHRLAGLVRQLRPSFRDAEGFYELRSEISGGLNALGRRLGTSTVPVMPVPPPSRPPPQVTPRVTVINGFTKRCLGCQQPFRAARPEQIHCSGRCRMRTYRQRLRAKAAKPAAGASAGGSVPEHPGPV
jgi:hypothetical protein